MRAHPPVRFSGSLLLLLLGFLLGPPAPAARAGEEADPGRRIRVEGLEVASQRYGKPGSRAFGAIAFKGRVVNQGGERLNDVRVRVEITTPNDRQVQGPRLCGRLNPGAAGGFAFEFDGRQLRTWRIIIHYECGGREEEEIVSGGVGTAPGQGGAAGTPAEPAGPLVLQGLNFRPRGDDLVITGQVANRGPDAFSQVGVRLTFRGGREVFCPVSGPAIRPGRRVPFEHVVTDADWYRRRMDCDHQLEYGSRNRPGSESRLIQFRSPRQPADDIFVAECTMTEEPDGALTVAGLVRNTSRHQAEDVRVEFVFLDNERQTVGQRTHRLADPVAPGAGQGFSFRLGQAPYFASFTAATSGTYREAPPTPVTIAAPTVPPSPEPPRRFSYRGVPGAQLYVGECVLEVLDAPRRLLVTGNLINGTEREASGLNFQLVFLAAGQQPLATVERPLPGALAPGEERPITFILDEFPAFSSFQVGVFGSAQIVTRIPVAPSPSPTPAGPETTPATVVNREPAPQPSPTPRATPLARITPREESLISRARAEDEFALNGSLFFNGEYFTLRNLDDFPWLEVKLLVNPRPGERDPWSVALPRVEAGESVRLSVDRVARSGPGSGWDPFRHPLDRVIVNAVSRENGRELTAVAYRRWPAEE